MDTLFSMKVFRQVVELNSFVATSEKLDISTAMTSKHVRHLEDYLGVRLLNRTSRRISLTNEGKVYYEQLSEILNELDDAESCLKSSSVVPRGVLKVAVPVWFHISKFTDAISKYCEKYPEVLIELSLNDRMVDLVEEGIDIALRVTDEPHSTLIAKRIKEVKFYIVASPVYLKKHGNPQNIEELNKHKFIIHSNIKNKNTIYYSTGDNFTALDIKPALSTNNTTLILNAALSGIGMAFLPEFLVKDDINNKKLEVIMPELEYRKVYLFAVYSSRRFLSPKVRTFIDFMSEWFKD